MSIIEQLQEIEKKEKEVINQPEKQEEPKVSVEPEQPEQKEEDVAQDQEPAEDSPEPQDGDSDDAPAPEDEKEKNRAFRELRKKAEEADKFKKENETLEARLRAIEERLQQSQQPAQQQAPQVNDPEPDKEYDRETWLEWKDRQLERKLESVHSVVQKQQEQSLISQAEKGLGIIEDTYRTQNPDYDGAVKFLEERIAAGLKLQNPNMNDAQIKRSVNEMKLMEAAKLAQGGVNPAEHFYKLAQIQYGYAKPEPKKDPQDGSNLDAIAKNQARSASLMGGSSRGKHPTIIDPARLDKMTNAEKIAAIRDNKWPT